MFLIFYLFEKPFFSRFIYLSINFFVVVLEAFVYFTLVCLCACVHACVCARIHIHTVFTHICCVRRNTCSIKMHLHIRYVYILKAALEFFVCLVCLDVKTSIFMHQSPLFFLHVSTSFSCFTELLLHNLLSVVERLQIQKPQAKWCR